ncbi:MAG: helix-turn-helix domain-containing protein [Terracidiphilus sp.]
MKLASPKITARARFAVNLRAARLARGLSQEELAAKAGLHRNYVGNVERNEKNISIDAIERLAVALETDVVELLARGER